MSIDRLRELIGPSNSNNKQNILIENNNEIVKKQEVYNIVRQNSKDLKKVTFSLDIELVETFNKTYKLIDGHINELNDITILYKTTVNYSKHDEYIRLFKDKTGYIKDSIIKFKKENQILKKKYDDDNLFEYRDEKIKELINKMHTNINNFKSECDKQLIRRAKLIEPKVTDETINELLESGITASQLIQKSIVNSFDTMNIKSIIGSIEERHYDIINLEKSVIEIYEMFKDMAVIIDIQQDQLDTIEKHINITKEKVRDGENNLNKAEKYQTKARKKLCCLLFILLAIILVILLPIFNKIGYL
jgi:t-SNARE complex subunit (syntaxin)